jgi:dienelactone hydrolase
MIFMRYIKVACLFLLHTQVGFAQNDSTKIIPPTGSYKTGNLVIELQDSTRMLQNKLRNIAFQLWFPISETLDQSKKMYKYSVSADYKHVFSNSAYNVLPSSAIKKAPLIIICPGRGVEKFGYTHLAEELASNGYFVLSIDMPEIGYVIYQDQTIIKPNSKYRPSRELMSGPYERVDSFFIEAANIGMQDISFVIANLQSRAKKDGEKLVYGKIDFQKIGIFGHSLGGRIAGAYAASNANVLAFISMEGIPPRQVRYEGINIPLALMYSSGQPPAALENYNSVVGNRKNDIYLIQLNKYGHNSVTDFPLVTPSQFKYGIEPVIAIANIRNLLLTYFNQFLKGKKHGLTKYKDLNTDIQVFK